MNVLDIDLDAFLSGVAHWSEGGGRLPADDFIPWSEAELRNFLEDQCGLTKTSKVPGRFNTEHVGAFKFFSEVAEKSGTKLALTHVDGHADLGLGDPGWVYLLGELMHKPLHERRQPRFEMRGCNPGNYLAYLCAAKVISEVEYVYPPGGGNDLLTYIFQDNDEETGLIELKGYSQNHLRDQMRRGREPDPNRATVVDAVIPFKRTPIFEFRNVGESYDMVFFCQSPAFTPASADGLLQVIADYLELDAQSEALP